jgi:hypothetical protein
VPSPFLHIQTCARVRYYGVGHEIQVSRFRVLGLGSRFKFWGLGLPVNVADDALRKVVIHHEVDALEINASGHQICANQNPDVPRPEISHGGVPLRLHTSPRQTRCSFDFSPGGVSAQ